MFHHGPEFFQQERARWAELNPQPETLPSTAKITQVATIAQVSLLVLGATIEEPRHETEDHENMDIEWPLRVTAKLGDKGEKSCIGGEIDNKMDKNKFVYTKAQSRVIGQEQLCPKIMKKVK